MKIIRLYSILALVSVLIASCGGEKENKTTETNSNLTSDSTAKEQVYKIYSLPAPMQLPSAIRENTTKFSEEFLSPTNLKKTQGEGTNVKKAVLLGVYGVDLGYCLLFDQNQSSINYLSKIAKLSGDMQITGAFESSVVKRLKDNMNNKDSASYILLNSYNNARNFFKVNKREESGFLVAAGSFVEGLHLSLSINNKNSTKEMVNVIGQQKIFLDNLVELLETYSTQAEIKSLSDDLKDLKASYDKITVNFVPSKDDPKVNNIGSVDAPADVLSSLLQKTEALRNKLLG